MIGSVGKLINRLSATTDKLIQNMSMADVFVLRESSTQNGRGGTRKTYNPTTAEALGCFYSVMDLNTEKLDEQRAAQRKPVIYRRFLLPSTTDVKADDKLRMEANGAEPQIEMEIVKPARIVGLFVEVITAQEVKQVTP